MHDDDDKFTAAKTMGTKEYSSMHIPSLYAAIQQTKKNVYIIHSFFNHLQIKNYWVIDVILGKIVKAMQDGLWKSLPILSDLSAHQRSSGGTNEQLYING